MSSRAFPEMRDSADVSLFCFAHAGGGASAFRRWAEELRPTIDVLPAQLRGREGRFREEPHIRMEDIVDEFAATIAQRLTRPFALFGHSFGALVAFEVAHEIERRTKKRPLHLFVSAARPPHVSATLPHICRLPDSEFVAEVCRRYGGIPQEILREPEFLAAILPSLRADLSINENYFSAKATSLSCAISALGGATDSSVTPELLMGWREHTTASFELKVLRDEGHFYLQSQRDAILADIKCKVLGESINDNNNRCSAIGEGV